MLLTHIMWSPSGVPAGAYHFITMADDDRSDSIENEILRSS